MSNNLVIVAIPAADDRVWKVSSEKVPHLTICFLGDAESNPNVADIMLFVEHAVAISEHGTFMMSVDYRDVLGDDKADVVFFEKDYSSQWIENFRAQLLQNESIRAAYESTEQYPEWRPHLTLGYPETPAKEDDSENGIHWVSFDRIAVWTGNYEGPEFRLKWPDRGELETVGWSMTETVETKLGKEFIEHYGVKGMQWGVRKAPPTAVAPRARSVVPHGTKRKTKIKVEGGEHHDASEDAIRVAEATAKLKKSGTKALSNKELQDLQNRLNLERNVKQLVGSTTAVGRGRKFVKGLTGLNKEVNDAVNTALNSARLREQMGS